MADEQRWNHNIHYHRMLLDAMPEPCTSALDVGCGEGVPARRMRQSISQVTAIDVDPNSIEIARRRDPESRIDYRLGDFMTASLEPASFDFVVCVAALHHMDEGLALRRMRELVRPGGPWRSWGPPGAAIPPSCRATPPPWWWTAPTGSPAVAGNRPPRRSRRRRTRIARSGCWPIARCPACASGASCCGGTP